MDVFKKSLDAVSLISNILSGELRSMDEVFEKSLKSFDEFLENTSDAELSAMEDEVRKKKFEGPTLEEFFAMNGIPMIDEDKTSN